MNYTAIIFNLIQLTFIAFPLLFGIILLFRSKESYDESYFEFSPYQSMDTYEEIGDKNDISSRTGLSAKTNRILKRTFGFLLILFALSLAYYLFIHEEATNIGEVKLWWQDVDADEATLSLSFAFAIAIPTRMTSTRFPGKALALLGGLTVLERVYRKCLDVKQAQGNIYILTDSQEIIDFADTIGAKAIMTSPKCNNGTERIVEALNQIDAEFIINVQGDEPFIPTELISELFDKYSETKCQLATAVSKIDDWKVLDNPNVVKALRNASGKIIYFSRQALPFQREENDKSKWLNNSDYFRHIGIYGYSKDVLEKYNDLPESKLEANEFLEQLRFVDANYNFECVETKYLSIGIDTPEDLIEAEKYLSRHSPCI